MNSYHSAQRLGMDLQLHDFIILFAIYATAYIALQIYTHKGIKNAINHNKKQIKTSIKKKLNIK